MRAAAPHPYDSLGLIRFAGDDQRFQNVIHHTEVLVQH